MMIVNTALGIVGIYLAAGIAFAIPFAWAGVNRIDPHAARGSWGFRVLIVPGAILLWPLLMPRWLASTGEPPVERTAHRLAAARKPGELP